VTVVCWRLSTTDRIQKSVSEFIRSQSRISVLYVDRH